MRRLFVLFAVLLIFAGCLGGGEPATGETWETSGADPGTQEHFNVEEGSSTQISAGEKETEQLAPAIEYAENPDANLFVYFITVGYGDTQGDAILIKKGDFDMLIDAGPIERKHEVVNFLFEKGVDDIEVLVSTHDDPEHSGGLSYVGENFRIGEIWRPAEGSSAYTAIINSIHSENGIKYMEKGNERMFNGVRIIVENPQAGSERFFDPDNDGIVLRVEDRDFCLLLTGDIDGSAQTKILMDTQPCEVVQMPWHGMSEGLSHLDFFFDTLEPKTIIISGSEKDWTNSRQTLYNKAALRGIEVYENYDGDSAKITYDGTDYAVTIEG